MSFISKVGLNTLWNTTRKVAKHYEYMVVDPIYVSKLERGLAGGKGKNIAKSTSECFEDAFKLTESRANGRNVFKRVWDSLKGIGKDYKALDMTKIKAAHLEKTGKELKFFGKLGKYLGPIGKRMPLIGNLLAIGFAIPTIINAFSNGGIGAGLKETAKEGFKLGVFTIGAAVGTAIGGPIGGIALGIGASLLAEKITGKTYSDKMEEAEGKTGESKTGEERQAQVTTPEARTGAERQVQTQQMPQTMGQYPNYNLAASNPYASNQIAFDPTAASSSNPFDMNADYLSQAQFGPSNNMAYGYPKQQFATR